VIRELRRYQLVTDLSVAAAFFALLLPTTFDSPSPLQAILVHALMALALAFRRLAPAIALAVAWVGALIQMAFASSVPAVSDLAILAVLFATASYGTRLVRWLGLASAVVGAVVATTYLVVLPVLGVGWFYTVRFPVPYTNGLPRIIPDSVLVLGASLAALCLPWTVGLLTRAIRRGQDSRQGRLQAERDVVVEQERNRIARDMHDVVAHSLAVVIAQADGARYLQDDDPGAVSVALKTIASTAREALSDVRVLLAELRDGLDDGPQPLLDDLGRLLDQFRNAGLAVRREDEGSPVALPTGQQLGVYRIVQEALTNALRHGDPSRGAVLRFTWTADALSISITSSLAGDETRAVPGNAGEAAGARGHGLTGMRERALIAGGTIAVSSEDGLWTVTARLPIRTFAVAP
jgi:signal transduction histidine kinase